MTHTNASLVKHFARESQALRDSLTKLTVWHEQIAAVVLQLQEAFLAGKKVLTAGNGGSATLAQHLAEELVVRYKADRRPYPAIALTADGSVLTCVGNDYGYDEVFARQIAALGQEGDVFIAYSTSGNSANILRACDVAKEQGMTVVAFTGQQGKLKDVADYAVISPATGTNRIQELDLHAIHLVCEPFEPVSEE